MGESLMKCVSIQSCQIVCTFQCGICRRIAVSNQEMRKAMTSIWTAKQKARELADRTAEALTDRTGQGTLDVAITVLISIVLGALILAGLYLIVDDTVLPTITQRIKDMFNYGG